MIRLQPPQNTEAEREAFDRCCERLAGFEPHFSFEYVDGFLAAVASGQRAPDAEQWLPALCGDTFERVFADPDDQAQALAALQARLRVLCRVLDPEDLFADPESLRLDPWVMDWTDEDREEARASGMDDEAVASLQLGAAWAVGFLAARDALPQLWPEPPDEDAAKAVRQVLDQITALALPPGGEAMKAHEAAYYPDRPPTRDDLLAEACMSVQDLRMFCVDFAPVPETRRVEAAPGRNDPCPCGSGKKFKKCHGAVA